MIVSAIGIVGSLVDESILPRVKAYLEAASGLRITTLLSSQDDVSPIKDTSAAVVPLFIRALIRSFGI